MAWEDATATVLEPIFELLQWYSGLRLVCQAWRTAYDAWAPRACLALKNFTIPSEAAEPAYAWAGLCLTTEDENKKTLPASHLYSQVNKLKITRRGIKTYGPLLSKFINLRSFTAVYCESLTDVSALGQMPWLRDVNLSGCSNLTDVSMLGHVHRLDLSLTNVSNVSALSNAFSLDCSGCQELRDISALTRVSFLYLNQCHGITHVPKFEKSCCFVCLVDCLGIGEITIECDASIELARCTNLRQVSVLSIANTVNLDYCTSLVGDIATLGNVRHLSLRGCTQLQDAASLIGRVWSLTTPDGTTTSLDASQRAQTSWA